MPERSTDFLILGGGTAGCALASRLKQYLPEASITLVEAGRDEHDNPLLTEPFGTVQLFDSEYHHKYETVPQKHCDGRTFYFAGGKALSGTSSVNYAAWIRGDRVDYDRWAELVKDRRWSYDGLEPYMRKSETHYDPKASQERHGLDGPIHTLPALSRTYTLTAKLREAYETIGVESIDDANAGSTNGMGPYIECWRDGKRQPAAQAYGLKGVEVLTNDTVTKILLQDDHNGGKKAVGARLASGLVIRANKEVILSCGAVRSPQVLMLSGIGPVDELAKYGIEQQVDAPHVGKNYTDHLSFSLVYRVRDYEKGYCAPHPQFSHPTYTQGFPTAVIIGQTVDHDKLKAALWADREINDHDSDQHPYLTPGRTHYEILPMYAAQEIPLSNLGLPTDGSVLSICMLNLLPTSRGTITLRSSNPSDTPVIDPNYCATETDRLIIREAVRRSLAAFETKAGQEIVEADVAPTGYPSLTSRSTDGEIDARIRRAGQTFFHGAGSVSMGKAVDSECRVYGVAGLRVVDASVFPAPLSCHYMVPVYALAEQMAEIIAAANKH